jgi:DNA-binding CsgD family transcriptional regulator
MTKNSYAQTKSKYLYFVALIGLGFLWTGTAYIIQAYRMLQFLDGGTVNLLVCGAYYVCQAAGIGGVALAFAKRPSIAGGRALPLWATIITVACAAASVFSYSLAVIITAGTFMNVTIGILSGCYLTRLATDIPQQRRGLVFGGAYAFGSIVTWLLSLPMNGRFLWNEISIFAVAILAAISLLLLRHLLPTQKHNHDAVPMRSAFNNKFIWLAATVLFLLSLESTLGFSFPLKSASGSVYIEFTRAFYAVGLLIAGLVSDKNRRWGAACCLAALAFPFAALALGSSVTGETIMWILAYLFLGFFSTYRVILFSDISGKTGLPAFAVLGLLVGRLGEAAGAVGSTFTDMPLIIFSGFVFILVIALFFLLYQKIYASVISFEEMEQRRLTTYVNHFSLSAREQEIFSLIIQGLSNAEIAAALYITESTVKFHASNIFKKTGLNSRSELITDFKLGKKV